METPTVMKRKPMITIKIMRSVSEELAGLGVLSAVWESSSFVDPGSLFVTLVTVLAADILETVGVDVIIVDDSVGNINSVGASVVTSVTLCSVVSGFFCSCTTVTFRRAVRTRPAPRVCHNMYSSNSHLKIAQGSYSIFHTLLGIC